MSDRPDRRDDAEIEATLRGLDAESLELLQPPPQVWDGIESAVRADGEPGGRVVPLEPRRRRARRIVLSSAAAAALAIVGVAAWVATTGDPDAVIASSTLAYEPDSFDPLGTRARASAELVERDGGHRIVIVDAVLPAVEAEADLEAWLIRPDDEDEHAGERQVERQRQHRDGDDRPADAVAEAQHQHARADFASGPHADGHREPLSPVRLAPVAQRREHLAQVAQCRQHSGAVRAPGRCRASAGP